MPPKKVPATSKKTEIKKKEKVIEVKELELDFNFRYNNVTG